MSHIEVRDVSLVYDTPSGRVPGVSGVSFDIAASEFLCIVGPSGCGKSTLLNIIAGFLPPSAGEIRIGGRPVTGHGMDRGVVFQDFAQLFPWRTALGNVAFGLEMKGVPKADRAPPAAAGEAGEIRPCLSASPVGRHAAARRHRPRARL
jgi:NitT/TauT family transport system ATP-binding protein